MFVICVVVKFALIARGGDLHSVSATSVFDRELDPRRLAALHGGGEFGAVAARIEQGGDTRDLLKVIARMR